MRRENLYGSKTKKAEEEERLNTHVEKDEKDEEASTSRSMYELS
jgi:hypothetical protein